MRVGIDIDLACIEEVSTSLARFGTRYLDRIFQDERALADAQGLGKGRRVE